MRLTMNHGIGAVLPASERAVPAGKTGNRESFIHFGQDDSETPPSRHPEPGILSLLGQYIMARIAYSRRQLQEKREWAEARHQREIQARNLAFDAFPPPTFEDRVKPVPFQRKRDIIRELTPLVDAGFASEAVDDILTPIATHSHPMVRRDFVFNLLGALKNDEAKACVLSHCLKHLRKDPSLENRQKIMDVIESLPPDPIPSEYHYLLFTPAHSHMRYWAAKLFSRDDNPAIRQRAQTVMKTSVEPPEKYR